MNPYFLASSILLTALITLLTPSSNWFTRFILFIILISLTRQIRLRIRLYQLNQRASARHARLAPETPSGLPFGLSIVFERLRSLSNGTPNDLHQLFRHHPAHTQVIRTRALGIEIVTTLSHLDAKHILTSGFPKWGKSPHFKEAFQPLLGDGVFTSDQRGLWSWHRAITRPHFARERIANVEAVQEHSARVISWLEHRSQQPVEIQQGEVLIPDSIRISIYD